MAAIDPGLQRERWQQALEAALETDGESRRQRVGALIDGLGASELADALEALAPEQRGELWQQIDAGLRGEVLVEVHGEVRCQLIDHSDHAMLVQAVAPLDLDALSDIDADLPPEVLESVLATMEPRRRQRFEQLRRYADDCAGGLMDIDPIAVHPAATLGDAAQVLRRHRDANGKLPVHLGSLMVTDHDGTYLGTIGLTELLVHDQSRPVAELMEREREPIVADMSAANVARRFEDRDLVSAAVVDGDGRLIGRITVDDVIDVIREQAERSQLANTGLDETVDTFAPALTASKRRAIWLGINLVNALIAAWIISLFEGTIDQLVALAVLMPVVASMGGVAGTQSLALMIRAIALDQVHGSARWRLLRRELAVGGLNGALWAVVVAGVAVLWFRQPMLAAVFAGAVVLNLMLGVLAGTTIPMVLNRFKIDPALAGGVLLVAMTDAIGFGVFLGLGSALLL